MLGLVQPAPGATVPADRPVVGLRFAALEPGDALDPASFSLSVDGKDRTAAFQVVVGAAAPVSGAVPSAYPGTYPTAYPGAYPTYPSTYPSTGLSTPIASGRAAAGEAWGALADVEGGGRAVLKVGAPTACAPACARRAASAPRSTPRSPRPSTLRRPSLPVACSPTPIRLTA